MNFTISDLCAPHFFDVVAEANLELHDDGGGTFSELGRHRIAASSALGRH